MAMKSLLVSCLLKISTKRSKGSLDDIGVSIADTPFGFDEYASGAIEFELPGII